MKLPLIALLLIMMIAPATVCGQEREDRNIADYIENMVCREPVSHVVNLDDVLFAVANSPETKRKNKLPLLFRAITPVDSVKIQFIEYANFPHGHKVVYDKAIKLSHPLWTAELEAIWKDEFENKNEFFVSLHLYYQGELVPNGETSIRLR